MASRSMLNTRADICGAERVFAEKQSGIKTDRAALARCCAPSLQAMCC
jgi:hypothetical protein